MKPYYELRWRVGRKVGRTIYAQLGDMPSDDDPLIGVMDSCPLATAAVDGHNGEYLEAFMDGARASRENAAEIWRRSPDAVVYCPENDESRPRQGL